jgi:hypothetical protein
MIFAFVARIRFSFLPSVQFRCIGLISGATAIALSAAYLGDTAGWSLAVPMIGIGLLLILAPIKAVPSQRLLVGLAGLLASAMLGFFPGSWFGSSEWYLHLRRAIPGLPLTLSLQPFQTLLCLGIFLASTLYGTWLIQWHPGNRIACLQLLVTGIAILAGIALMNDLLQVPYSILASQPGLWPIFQSQPNRCLDGTRRHHRPRPVHFGITRKRLVILLVDRGSRLMPSCITAVQFASIPVLVLSRCRYVVYLSIRD